MKTQNPSTTSKLTPKKAIILILPVVFAIVAALSVALLVQGGLKRAEDPTPPPPAESSTEPKDVAVIAPPPESEADTSHSKGLEFRSNGDGTATLTGIGTCTDREVIIPDTTPSGDLVIAIGSKAFKGISAIGEVVFPPSLMTIGEDAFRGSGITSVSIGSSVISIEEGAFADCRALTAINASKANAMYASKDGILFNRELTEIICYPSGRSNRRYAIPSSVTQIAPSAFSSCDNLREISFEGTEKQWNEVYVYSGNSSLYECELFFAPDEK